MYFYLLLRGLQFGGQRLKECTSLSSIPRRWLTALGECPSSPLCAPKTADKGWLRKLGPFHHLDEPSWLASGSSCRWIQRPQQVGGGNTSAMMRCQEGKSRSDLAHWPCQSSHRPAQPGNKLLFVIINRNECWQQVVWSYDGQPKGAEEYGG